MTDVVKSAAQLQDELDTLANQFTDLYQAANQVTLAAWTDRHSRLHGHETVVALDRLLKTFAPLSPLTDAPSTPAEGVREKVARFVQGGDGWEYDGDCVQAESYAAADAILSAIGSAV